MDKVNNVHSPVADDFSKKRGDSRIGTDAQDSSVSRRNVERGRGDRGGVRH